MEINRNLTRPHNDRMQQLIADSPEGMAHWAGTGPEGRTCRECIHFDSPGYYSDNNIKSAGQLKPGRCIRYKKMMGKNGLSFLPTTKSCRFFEENPEPKSLKSKW